MRLFLIAILMSILAVPCNAQPEPAPLPKHAKKSVNDSQAEIEKARTKFQAEAKKGNLDGLLGVIRQRVAVGDAANDRTRFEDRGRAGRRR